MKNYGIKALIGGIAIAALAASAPAFAAFEGFGKDIPLDSAARQIVPEGWAVDYGSGVDSKVTVSWSSSSDWQSALKSAVAKRGYTAQIGSNTVVISKATEAPRPYASAPSAFIGVEGGRPARTRPALQPPLILLRQQTFREIFLQSSLLLDGVALNLLLLQSVTGFPSRVLGFEAAKPGAKIGDAVLLVGDREA